MWERSEKMGNYLVTALKKELENSELVENISGIGMEIGVHLKKTKSGSSITRNVMSVARKKGLHITYADDYNFQLMPPLTIEKKDVDLGIEILVNTLKSF